MSDSRPPPDRWWKSLAKWLTTGAIVIGLTRDILQLFITTHEITTLLL